MNSYVVRVENGSFDDDGEISYEEYDSLQVAEVRAKVLREYQHAKVEIYRLL